MYIWLGMSGLSFLVTLPFSFAYRIYSCLTTYLPMFDYPAFFPCLLIDLYYHVLLVGWRFVYIFVFHLEARGDNEIMNVPSGDELSW